MVENNNLQIDDEDIPNIELEPTFVTYTGKVDGVEDKDDLLLSVLNHKDDVETCMMNIGSYLEEIGEWHDWTKLHFFEEFANDTLERLSTPDFKSREWYNIHTTLERHHVNANVPTKVNLFDILEMIVDCTITGKTRGEGVNPYFLILKDDLLEKAYWNTVELLDEKIKLKE